MQTLERKQPRSEMPALSPLRQSVFAAAIVVLVLAVGFGTWMLVDEYTGVDRQIELLIDEYDQAWEDGDGEAALALMSPMGQHFNRLNPQGIRGEELVDFIESWYAISGDIQFRVTGDPTIIETANEYLVMVPGTVGTEAAPTAGFSFFVLAEVDGELEIRQHHWIER